MSLTRAFFILLFGALALVNFCMALATDDPQKKQTRLLYSIWFAVAEVTVKVSAIAQHMGLFNVK